MACVYGVCLRCTSWRRRGSLQRHWGIFGRNRIVPIFLVVKVSEPRTKKLTVAECKLYLNFSKRSNSSHELGFDVHAQTHAHSQHCRWLLCSSCSLRKGSQPCFSTGVYWILGRRVDSYLGLHCALQGVWQLWDWRTKMPAEITHILPNPLGNKYTCTPAENHRLDTFSPTLPRWRGVSSLIHQRRRKLVCLAHSSL